MNAANSVWRTGLLPFVLLRWHHSRIGMELFGMVRMERGSFTRVLVVSVAQAAAYLFVFLHDKLTQILS